MSDEIVWEDPPKIVRRGRDGIWRERLAPLVEKRGAWARVRQCATPSQAASWASNLRRRQVLVPPGKWEFKARTARGSSYVYARYLGPEDDA